ncbi:cyclophilin-like domain-containing protein [Chytriomyces sp. MP71]|nr:cyclophilin-like domain-containing protein [Chytriomyces sp. MP71]
MHLISSLLTLAGLLQVKASRHDLTITNYVYFDVKSAGNPLGRIVFGLFGKLTPKTAKNFLELSTGELGYGYKGTRFHRVIKNFMIQGGDFETGDGHGGHSIYGRTFPDEKLNVIDFDKPGTLAMANSGPNTNGAQFFITNTPNQSFLSPNYVAFGKVVCGMDVVYAISNSAIKHGTEMPLLNQTVIACGEVKGKVKGGPRCIL